MKVLLMLVMLVSMTLCVQAADVKCSKSECSPGNTLKYSTGDGYVCCDPKEFDYFQVTYIPPRIWEAECYCRKN
ncbi:hypothetical protein RRG08_027083 [Elysia crispata]|uniref:Plethodontid modulating factor n=1 Tax=Elysia crispata TaxID=231223 RepID=A0AAE1CPQ1_9GAST|nr:hypothetical protein RRG08_027083 [Elysia crispata]